MIVSGRVFSPPSSAGSGRSGGAPLPIEVAAVTPVPPARPTVLESVVSMQILEPMTVSSVTSVPPAEPTVIDPVTTMQILDPIRVTNFEEVG